MTPAEAPAQDHVSRALLAAADERFEHFYEPLARRFDRDLAGDLDQLSAAAGFGRDDFDAATIRARVVEQHCRDLATMCIRTLTYEFRSWSDGEGRSVASDGSGRYVRFHEWLAGEGHVELLARYPVLDRQQATLAAGTRRLIVTALRRFAADRDDLAALGLCSGDRRVVSITVTDGDTHNGGQRVLVLHTDSADVVYKPRSLASDEFVTTLAAEVNAHLDPTYRMRFPGHLNRDTYGWQELIRAAECRDEAEVRTYFGRMGALLGFFNTICTSDLHYDNLIAAGPDPVFFDLETFAQREVNAAAAAAVGRTQTECLQRSVLNSLILPARFHGSPFDQNIAGIGAVGEQVSSFWNTYGVLGSGTDEFRIGKAPASVAHHGNLVRLRGRTLDPNDYEDAVAEGLAAALHSVERCHERLRSLAAAFPGPLGARQVLRATAVYCRFREAATHPRYLRSEAAQDELFARLRRVRRLPPPHDTLVADEERRALREGDVPYFWSGFDDHDLVANGATTVPGVFDTTMRDEFVSRLTPPAHDPGRIARTRQHTRMSFFTTRERPWDRDPGSRDGYLRELLADPDPDRVARAVGDHFAATAWLGADSAVAVWLGAVLDPAGGPMAIDLGRPVLYEDGGSLLFLAELAQSTAQPSRRELAVAATRELGSFESEAWQARGLSVPDSAYVGVPSVGYVCALAGVVLDNADLIADGQRLMAERPAATGTALADGRAGAPHASDLVGGAAGLLLLDAGLHESRPGPLAVPRPLLEYAARVVADRTLPTGLAHGSSGVVRALAAAVATTAAEPHRELAGTMLAAVVRALETALETAPEPERSVDLTWCTGLPGAISACARAARDLGVLDSFGDRLATLTADLTRRLAVAEEPADLSLCHGMAGQVAALIDLADDLSEPGYVTAARDHWDRTVRRAGRDGYSGGLARSHGLTSFFLGLSGVGYVGLKLADPRVVSPWNLELRGRFSGSADEKGLAC